MPSPERNEKLYQASQEAAYWWIRAEDEALTPSDRGRLSAWLKQSPENIAAFLQVMDVDGKTRGKRLLDGINSIDFTSYLPQDTKATAPARHKQAASDLLSLSLSSTYFTHFRKANRPARLALGGVSLLIVVASILGFPGALPIAGFSVTFLAAVMLKEAVVGYRISRGLFGSTAAETRLLLRFLIQNSATIDFDDRNGRPRRVFERTVQSAGRQKVLSGAITE